MKIKLKKTDRGFLRGEFVDLYGEACSIQESSMDGQAIWLGCDHETIHQPTKQPCGARMHLDRALARKLGAMLQRFADTGELE